jgi:hypothetical protein
LGAGTQLRERMSACLAYKNNEWSIYSPKIKLPVLWFFLVFQQILIISI